VATAVGHPYYLDVGTGDSALTWQASGGQRGTGTTGGSAADVPLHLLRHESDRLLQNVSLGGPAIGVNFRF